MKIPIYFYYPNEILVTLDYKSGLDCWILKTFLSLKNNNRWDINIGNSIPEKGIILFHKGFFPKNIIPSKDQLLVCIQADYGRYKYAQCHILQNPVGVNNFKFSKKSFIEEKAFSFVKNSFIPHWNQENIIPRDKSRAELFENVCFYGVTQNFPEELSNQEFINQLLKHGIKLRIITESSQWNDYSQTDCVLAIRDFNIKPHFNKPFSKIINGYLAGVPVIAGSESSALYLRNKLNITIPIVKSKEDCFNEIIKCKKEYQDRLHEVKLDNSKLKCFQDPAIIIEWNNLLEQLQLNYCNWQKSSVLTKKLFYKFCRI